MPEALRHLVRRRIQLLRVQRGLTQEAPCERAAISLDAVSRIEGGSRVPTLDTVERIAAALDVSVEELLRSQPPPRAVRRAVPVQRVVALLERQPASVQSAAEGVVRAMLRLAGEARRAERRRA